MGLPNTRTVVGILLFFIFSRLTISFSISSCFIFSPLRPGVYNLYVSMIEYHQIEKNAVEGISQKMKPDTQGQSDPLFYSKIDSITSGLQREYSKGL